MAFINPENIDSFYNDIKNSKMFDDNKYKQFFAYFEKNWLKKNLYQKWNYHDILKVKNNFNNETYLNDYDKDILLTDNACETLHSFIKLMIANNTEVNVHVFSNIITNLISKNNFDSNVKRKVNTKNTYHLNVMNKKFSSNLIKIANINNKLKVFNYEDMMSIIDSDFEEDKFLFDNEN